MSDENGAGTVENIKKDEGKRQRSSIAFPYMDLNEAIALAKAIHNNVGTGTCSDKQLGPWVKLSPTSSGFRSRLTASRLFGLIDTDRWEALRLAELGRLVVDSKREREGRAKAFLNVPLYAALHDKYRGSALPPTAALEKELVGLGVASTLTDTARRVLERSAEQAGFYEAGRDRLVLPGYTPSEAAHEVVAEKQGGGGNGGRHGGSSGGGNDIGEHDPLIIGLFRKLPPPESEWSTAARLKRLQTAANIFDLLYTGDGGGIAVTAARAERSPRPHDHD